eukprot:1393853-Alexandrium_andersonii.AAC.1
MSSSLELLPGAFGRPPSGDGDARAFCRRRRIFGGAGRPSPLPAFRSCDHFFQACVGLTACLQLFQGRPPR